MKVSVQWMKQFGGKGLNDSIDELVQKIGAQLGAVDEVIEWGQRYEKIMVVKVVSCIKHPNADKLHVCLVDDGGVVPHVARDEKGLVQIVCGATNVRAGMLAAWIPPGVTVPNTLDKDPFILEAREIRGQMSNGMLASLHELGISDDHAGILEIDPAEKAQPGSSLKNLYGLDDHVIDIENKMFTHRPDLFGQLGVAREISGINRHAFKSPAWYVKETMSEIHSDTAIKGLNVKNEVPDLCPRYMGVVIDNVSVEQSPVWLQATLSRVGIRPINNIVDMTNYIMMLTGQPLHAFDFDKVAVDGRATIVVRNPKKNEKLTLLDGKSITPRQDAVLICDQDKPIALGGVMGGNNSEIDEATKRIIIECANFDMYNIRKTSMEHGLFTDAVTRFSKGQSVLQCPAVLAKAVQVTKDLIPGARVATKVADSHRVLHAPSPVTVSADFINERLGTSLSLKDMAKLLENVEFKMMSVPADKKRLHVVAPFWRTDIEIPEDIVEEVGRLYGYDHLPVELPERNIMPAPRDQLRDFQDQLRAILSGSGANELLTYTFVHANLLEKVGQDPKVAFKLSNAISPDLQHYRLSLLPSLLEKVHANLKSDRIRSEDNEFAAFEINPVYAKGFLGEDNLPAEDRRLALVFAADDKTARRKYDGAGYYAVRAYADALFSRLGIVVDYKPAQDHSPKEAISKAAFAPFDKNRSGIITSKSGEFIGEIGEFTTSVRRNLKLPQFTAGFELDVMALMKAQSDNTYSPLSRFPKVMQDITLRTPKSVTFGEVYQLLQEEILSALPDGSVPVLGLPRVYQPRDDMSYRNITLRLWVSNYDRTLKAEEVNTVLDMAAQKASERFDVSRI